MNSMHVTWEAEYFNGLTLRENQGELYADIDRDQLSSFRLVSPGEILVELRVKPGQNGHGLVYRRRTIFAAGGFKEVWFIVGILPLGPVVSYQPETDQVLKADKFESGSGPLGKPEPLPFERWTNTSHSADAVLRATKVTLPSGYVLSV